MNGSHSISVIDPVGKAYDWMLQVLFRPFDPGKWFTIGFCAWLAYFGENGGSGFNYPGGGGNQGHGGSLRTELGRIQDFVTSNLYWIVPVAAGVILLSLAFMVLFLWLSSRGKFMFLHCVARNRSEVAWPWNQYRREADSLFRFRVVLALIGCFLFLPLIALAVFAGFRMAMASNLEAGWVVLLIASALSLLLLALVWWILKRLIEDVMVPIMFVKRGTWREGWHETWAVVLDNAGVFALYFLFRIVLGLATGLIVLLVVLFTCCIAGCLMLIPYIGTVLLLPVLVFYRAYSAHFVAQFSPQYDAFSAAPA